MTEPVTKEMLLEALLELHEDLDRLCDEMHALAAEVRAINLEMAAFAEARARVWRDADRQN
ncbi:hypothetical protein H5395_10730 [Paracoccus sp. MC1854]|uniref:hypothetical protein n=1 Tax=Paracoccus sp. MC1854 TaxID=2760306 RepID=UPI001601E8FA|nr:hypothetical protein [Paracoccus sp. MC1854]MBB1492001.1 hypothetical protein [Paracoccus sp. MC1854]